MPFTKPFHPFTHPNSKPNLGIGVGFRAYHYQEIVTQYPPVDWFEIISENFMGTDRESESYLEKILDRYPVVLHGVSLSIGSADPLDFEYLKRLKALARKTKTPWLSDHLSWGHVQGAHFHDLLPLPFTRSTAAYVAERARIVQDFLEIPFALENVSSYITYPSSEMPEWEFYRSVVEQADILMMLDVNNIYVNARNHCFDPEEYFRDLPLERVIQIHLAGHTDFETYCLDSHNQPVCDAVWQLYGQVIRKLGPISTLLEWDDDFISFEATWKEALRAKEFCDAVATR